MCDEPLPARLSKILSAGVPFVMLREKDLPPDELLSLARRVAEVAAKRGARLIINSGPEAAEAVGAWALHLPFHSFMRGECKPPSSMRLGLSVHSLEEALAAEKAGADYVLAGNIFETACKEGLPGRGLGFLSELAERLSIPVWAVAAVACVRSFLMCGPPDRVNLLGENIHSTQLCPG